MPVVVDPVYSSTPGTLQVIARGKDPAFRGVVPFRILETEVDPEVLSHPALQCDEHHGVVVITDFKDGYETVEFPLGPGQGPYSHLKIMAAVVLGHPGGAAYQLGDMGWNLDRCFRTEIACPLLYFSVSLESLFVYGLMP